MHSLVSVHEIHERRFYDHLYPCTMSITSTIVESTVEQGIFIWTQEQIWARCLRSWILRSAHICPNNYYRKYERSVYNRRRHAHWTITGLSIVSTIVESTLTIKIMSWSTERRIYDRGCYAQYIIKSPSMVSTVMLSTIMFNFVLEKDENFSEVP